MLSTVGDLVFYFPRRYEDYSQTVPVRDLVVGSRQTVRGTLWQVKATDSRRGLKMIQASLIDGTGVVRLTWFNQMYLKDQLLEGAEIVVSGEVQLYRGYTSFSNPSFEVLEKAPDGSSLHVGRIVPIYAETEGLTSKWLRQKIRTALDLVKPQLVERLPSALVVAEQLVGMQAAIEELHFPSSNDNLKRAKERVGFEELFIWQLKSLWQRQQWELKGKAFGQRIQTGKLSEFKSQLPFELTQGQRVAVREILQAICADAPMARLLEGDVGSGKTVVAATALVNTVANGHQAALMAPTEILAEQHFRGLNKLLLPLKFKIGLITGTKNLVAGLPETGVQLGLLEKSEEETCVRVPRTQMLELIKTHQIDVLIGTHALIGGEVKFDSLALVVIDEQHRFGVMQRTELTQKGGNPDVLVMTATPIPRTLALALYGDLDLSILEEMPAGRKPIVTKIVPEPKRASAYTFVIQQLQEGHQTFVVCPLIDESETLEVKAATETFAFLQNGPLREWKVGLLHGRLKTREKDGVIEAFRRHELDVLVSTSVVEVGVDIPNATVMMIEGADRFGLSQLHQFRGRVGRGQAQSYCFLLSESENPESAERLTAFARTQNGFELAEADLKLRGPGEVFGARQSGMPDLKMASLLDVRLLKRTRTAALAWLPRLAEMPVLGRQIVAAGSELMLWH